MEISRNLILPLWHRHHPVGVSVECQKVAHFYQGFLAYSSFGHEIPFIIPPHRHTCKIIALLSRNSPQEDHDLWYLHPFNLTALVPFSVIKKIHLRCMHKNIRLKVDWFQPDISLYLKVVKTILELLALEPCNWESSSKFLCFICSKWCFRLSSFSLRFWVLPNCLVINIEGRCTCWREFFWSRVALSQGQSIICRHKNFKIELLSCCFFRRTWLKSFV